MNSDEEREDRVKFFNSYQKSDLDSEVYKFSLEVIKKKTAEVFDSYNLQESNPLEMRFLTKDALLESIETDHPVIIRKLHLGVKKIIRKARHNELKTSELEELVNDLKRETWNFLYEKYVLKG